MKQHPPSDFSDFTEQPRTLRGLDLGLLAGIAVAAVYGFAADPVGLSWGLVAVGFIGGIVIGAAVSRGAWANRPHPRRRGLQLTAGLIAIGAWIVGLFVAYVMSQAFYPQATTNLVERISLGGFSDYFSGLFDALRFVHAAGVAAMAFMAWRGAR